MKISVIGAGYVGLTTAACLAQIGHSVFCSESDAGKLAKLQSGVLPIFEPHLEAIVRAGIHSGTLRFGSTEEGLAWANVVFICVGTPPLTSGDADLSAIEGVARTLTKHASGYYLVIEKSTVPVQTGSRLKSYLLTHSRPGQEYDVASNPEFLREGTAVQDFLHPDRIVIGVESPRAATLLEEIYQPVVNQSFTCPLHIDCADRVRPRFLVTDTKSAELIKHASNSFLAMKISFVNMVADLCEFVGADISKVSEGMGLDPRIGSAFLNPGIGFGGFCFPKDLQAFIRIAEKFGCNFALLKEVEKINQQRIDYFVEKVRRELWVLRGKKIAVWGLAFKPNTDDIRFAPSLVLLRQLLEEGAIVRAYDSQATAKASAVVPEVAYCKDPYQAAEGAEAILIVTEWDEFRRVDWERVGGLVEHRLILDGRNMLNPQEMKNRGFRYVSVGRPSATPLSQTDSRSAEMPLEFLRPVQVPA